MLKKVRLARCALKPRRSDERSPGQVPLSQPRLPRTGDLCCRPAPRFWQDAAPAGAARPPLCLLVPYDMSDLDEKEQKRPSAPALLHVGVSVPGHRSQRRFTSKPRPSSGQRAAATLSPQPWPSAWPDSWA